MPNVARSGERLRESSSRRLRAAGPGYVFSFLFCGLLFGSFSPNHAFIFGFYGLMFDAIVTILHRNSFATISDTFSS